MDFSFFGRGWGVRLLRSKGLVMKLQNEHLFLDVLNQIGWLRGWLMEICGRCTSPPPTPQPLSFRAVWFPVDLSSSGGLAKLLSQTSRPVHLGLAILFEIENRPRPPPALPQAPILPASCCSLCTLYQRQEVGESWAPRISESPELLRPCRALAAQCESLPQEWARVEAVCCLLCLTEQG